MSQQINRVKGFIAHGTNLRTEMKTLVEIVCCTVEDAIAAEAGGADRIELCSALQVGGLTPSLGLLRGVKAHTTIPVMAMVRPRPAGFCYSHTELDVMRSDARSFLDSGADGIVFGCLTAEGDVDMAATQALIQIASGRETVFHRAFDITRDSFSALETLVKCGVTRILTSGQSPTAVAGAITLKRLQTLAYGRVEILPGGGIRAHNVAEVVRMTGCRQVHLAPRSLRGEAGTSASRAIDYGEDGRVTADAVAEVIWALQETVT